MLHNATLSTISIGLWNTTTNVAKGNFTNAYSFSGPRRFILIMPYTACLLVGMVFVRIGLHSLFENVVAASNGFLQIIQTSRGSVDLDYVARGGSLGGPDNVPRALKDIELVFGELKNAASDNGVVRRAGWGSRCEVMPLTKEKYYGG